MRFTIKLIEAADISDVIAVINESSRGLSFELRLDRTKFLALSSFGISHTSIRISPSRRRNPPES